MAESFLQLPLQPGWMERRYFGKDHPDGVFHPNGGQQPPAQRANANAGHGSWTRDGMACCALREFLDNHTGGTFLVAGPRGSGKTSLVRHALTQWRDDGPPQSQGWTAALKSWIRNPCRSNPAASEDKATASDPVPTEQAENAPNPRPDNGPARQFVIVDAADLGLFEPDNERTLERILITGLLRVIQEAMIPPDYRSGTGRQGSMPWRNKPSNQEKSFQQDLITVTELATAQESRLQRKLAQHDQQSLSGSAGFSIKAKFGPSVQGKGGLAANKRREQAASRTWHLSWTNDTDAVRAQLRVLFRENRELSWPVLVLDEWDRFEDDWEQIGKPEQNGQGTTGTEQAKKPPEDTQRRLDQVLKAMARLKGLLADYPAPVIVVGGTKLYGKVRRSRGSSQTLTQHETPSATVFTQQCFLSPAGTDPEQAAGRNPLLPYLECLILEKNVKPPPAKSLVDLQELADFLLFEVGPNPHSVKQFLAHFSLPDGNGLKLSWGLDARLKCVLGKTLVKELANWRGHYGSTISAGPYTRFLWLSYLRQRLWCYWSAPATRPGNLIGLPTLGIGTIHTGRLIPHQLLLLLGEKPDTLDKLLRQPRSDTLPPDVDKEHLDSQRLEVDLQLLNTFHTTLAIRYGSETDSAPPKPLIAQAVVDIPAGANWQQQGWKQVDHDPERVEAASYQYYDRSQLASLEGLEPS